MLIQVVPLGPGSMQDYSLRALYGHMLYSYHHHCGQYMQLDSPVELLTHRKSSFTTNQGNVRFLYCFFLAHLSLKCLEVSFCDGNFVWQLFWSSISLNYIMDFDQILILEMILWWSSTRVIFIETVPFWCRSRSQKLKINLRYMACSISYKS
jgi:hypothetical protein